MLGLTLSVRRSQQPLSLLAQALSAIRRNGGTALYVPDDYGLVLGPELVTNGDFSNGTTGWVPWGAASGLAVSAGAASFSAEIYNGITSAEQFSLQAGRRYRVAAKASTSTGTYQFGLVKDYVWDGLSNIGGSETVLTDRNFTFVASGGSSYQFLFWCQSGGPATLSIDNISVREILSATSFIDSTGTQPVTAVNDLVGLLTDRSYGAGNLGPELVTNGGPFTTATGWTAFNANGALSVVGGRLRNTATAQFDSGLLTTLSMSVAAGKRLAVTLDVYQSTAGRRLAFVSGGELYYTSYGMPAGYSRITFNAPQGSTTNSFYVRFAGATEQVGEYFEIASISVREVLGNHATQPTTASKPQVTQLANGTKALDFDGSNDFLSIGSAPFQQSQDHFICCSFTYTATASNQSPIGVANDTGWDRAVALHIWAGSNAPAARWISTDLTTAYIVGPALVSGQTYVMSAMRSGNTGYMWINGSLAGTVNLSSLTASASTRVFFGKGSGNGDFFDGQIVDACVVPNALTEADRKTIERNMAQRAGVAYVG